MSKTTRIIYAGTPEFSLPPLQALHKAGMEICAVYTQPDRKAGRGRKLTASPIKRWALENGVIVEQPETLRNCVALEKLVGYKPDLMVVTAYGLILPPEALSIPRCGCVNLHASLLPRWRGAAPIQRAILAGDKEGGVTLMQMDAGLDTGPMLAKKALQISVGETSAELHERLAELGVKLLLDNLSQILSGTLIGVQQENQNASYANKIKKEEAWIDWNQSAEQIARKVAAFNSWPIAQTCWHEQTLRIWRAESVDTNSSGELKPGEVIATVDRGIDIACGQGVLRVSELQLPGGRAIGSADFIHAHNMLGVILG